MRIAALIFALIGVAGSGLMCFILLDEIRKKQAELGPNAPVDNEKLKLVKLTIYGTTAGVALGAIGGYLALAHKGKFAAVLLLAGYAAPFVILAVGAGIDFSDKHIPRVMLSPAGFLVAAFFSLFVRSGTPYRVPLRDADILEDDDMV